MIANSKPESQLIFQSKRQLTLYLLSALCFSLSAFIFYMIFKNFELFSSEFKSKVSLIIFLIFILTLGNSLTICMLWLSGRYVLKIEYFSKDEIAVKIWSILGFHNTRIYPIDIFKSSKVYLGELDLPSAPSVNAPWIRLKTPKGKLLIIDLQGEFFSDILS